MTHRHLQVYFFLTIFIGAFVLVFFMFKPFLSLIVVGGILAFLVWPIYKWLLKYYRGQRTLASLSTVIITLLIVLLPLALLVISLAMEAVQLFSKIRGEIHFSNVEKVLAAFLNPEQAALATEQLSRGVSDVAAYIQPVVSSLSSNVVSIFSNTVGTVLGLVIVLLVMYYLLKDGPALKKELIDLSPLDDKDDLMIFRQVKNAVTAVAYGEFVVSLIKGVLGGLLFLVLGLSGPVFWGTMIALSNLIPGIGTALITIPYAVYLFLTGQIVTGIIFAGVSFLIIGLIDNFLMPQLIRSRIHIHPLLILFSILGGVLFFGPVGLFFGPIIISVTLALIDIYKKEFRQQVKKLK